MRGREGEEERENEKVVFADEPMEPLMKAESFKKAKKDSTCLLYTFALVPNSRSSPFPPVRHHAELLIRVITHMRVHA